MRKKRKTIVKKVQNTKSKEKEIKSSLIKRYADSKFSNELYTEHI